MGDNMTGSLILNDRITDRMTTSGYFKLSLKDGASSEIRIHETNVWPVTIPSWIDFFFPIEQGKSTFQVTRIFPSRWKTVFIPRTDLGRRLYALRNKAIVSGMKLLSEEEILEEIKYRRGEIEEKESNLH